MGKIAFTASRVAAFNCPPNKSQAFLWDATTPGLGLRNTPKGQAAYVFQGVFGGKDLRITIGSPRAWSIPDAQSKAREYQRLIDQGLDPREQRRQRLAEDAAAKAASLAQAVVGLDVWDEYVKERKPHWGTRHYEDNLSMVKEGGLPSKNHRRQLTVEGPLRGLLQMRLIDLKSEQVEEWARTQAAERPTYARLSWRCLKAFLNWCAEHPAYATLLPPSNPAKTKKIREVLGKPNVKKDALQREQLPAWFQAVQQLPNPVVSAYLQVLLLTGARPGEVQDLEWANVDFAWNALTISDKVEGERKIPLTPYVRSLLEALPQRNRWVFASPRTDGPLSRLDTMHNTACKAAGIQGLTLHGLRRSFKSLTEWLDIPAGVVAQLMGHKPSATAEKHYTVRPLDLLRMHHTRIEAWILEQAGMNKDSPHDGADPDSPE